MALINCPNCNEQISDKAINCPHCHCNINDAKTNIKEPEVKEPDVKKLNEQETSVTKISPQKDKKRISGKKIAIIAGALLAVIALVVFIFVINSGTKPNQNENNTSTQSTNSDLPTTIEYGFIDYMQFSKYWFDGVYRCGTDFEAGDYYILPLFGTGAIYDVCDSPDGFSWTYHRMLRKISVEEGKYVNVAHGGIMVSAEEVDTNEWSKYGTFLVGKDLLAGEYKIETISTEYSTDLYSIQSINGAYQINEKSLETDPVDCNQLFDDSAYITLEDGQYITITNAKLSNVNLTQSGNANSNNEATNTEQENETTFSMDAKPIDDKEYQHDDFAYIIYDDGSIELTKYLGDEDDVTISKEINGYAVSRIGASAFENCSTIKDIYLFADIISIGDRAFKGCTKLEDFTIPQSVKTIGISAFEGCSDMTDVYMFGGITIGDCAFKNCTSLEDFTIPKEAITIGTSAFEGCTDMTDVYVFGGETIGDRAFKNCTSLEDFTIPKGMKSIGVSAFEGCSNLKDVYVFSDNVTYGLNAFANCSKLEDMPEGAVNDYSKLESTDADGKTETIQPATKITARKAKQTTEEILEEDLGKSVKITKLYFNEELQGCYVEFKVGNETDAAAVHLDTEVVDYKSEFDYYSKRATELRKQTPINENELHKCNQAILSSSYADWSFAVTVLEKEGGNSKNGWEKIK